MNLRQKIGQMLVMGFQGCDLDSQSPVVQWIKEEGIGGVLLFDYDVSEKRYGKNLKNAAQIKQLTHKLKKYAQSHQEYNPTLPLFIAVDYEGGAVDRLTKIDGSMKTMKAKDQALLSDDDLYQEASRMAATLAELGFNLNFAPVIDLSLEEQDGIIGKLGRSFSAEPSEVVRAAKQFVKAFAHYGIVCAYKHFPGHGSARGDTHQGFVDVTESYQPCELLPYQKLLNDPISANAMVMTAHVINNHLDSNGIPATLSYPIITELLRKQIGFDGVVISDDLQMQAISNHYPLAETLRMTINAGADMLIIANQLGSHTAHEVVDCIQSMVLAGDIMPARIDEAYHRIFRLKETELSPLYS